MIDIPINKALVPMERVENLDDPVNCEKECAVADVCSGDFACKRHERKDGKNVIFKLIDLPKEKKHG